MVVDDIKNIGHGVIKIFNVKSKKEYEKYMEDKLESDDISLPAYLLYSETSNIASADDKFNTTYYNTITENNISLITGTTTHKYAPTTYTWEHTNTVNSTASAIDKTNHILYTQENLEKSNLGSVAGNVSLTIKGNSKIGTDGDTTGTKGNVFGGGESSYVTGATNKVTVNLQGNTEVLGNVFGGGDNGEVQGSTEVNIMQPTTTP